MNNQDHDLNALRFIESLGCAILPRVFTSDQLDQLLPIVDDVLTNSQSRAGARVNTSIPMVQAILSNRSLKDAIGSLGDYRPVRVIVFDKTSDHNWAVPWHRDTTIAVRTRHEVDGFGPWSVKEGIDHVQPPPSVLSGMITARVHLDPAPATNGALRVIPGSHLDIGECWAESDPGHQEREAITLEADAGDVVLMNPLTLHASSKSSQPDRRRIVHIEFAKDPLPKPLAWYVD